MKVLCLFGLFPNEYLANIEKDSISGMQNAANKLQWAILEGLDQQERVETDVCNSLYIGAYPRRYRKWRIPTFAFSHNNRNKGINVGFINLPFIKIISRYHSIKRYIDVWARKNITEKDKALIIYALTTPFTWIANYVQAKYKDIKVCIVVPDLPEYMNVAAMKKKGIYHFLKSIEIINIRYSIRHIENFVLLTDAMKEWFGRTIHYTVVEGIASQIIAERIDVNELNCDEKHIIYAGGIKREYGVADLVESFCRIKASDWVLDIYGDGVDLDDIRRIAQQRENVIFHGRVSNEKVVRALSTASILVNPRNNQEFAAYSFPSKIMEYMASGTPMLAYKLDGIPLEYEPYYYHIQDAENGMETAMRVVMNASEEERRCLGNRAKQFVAEMKNPVIQTKRILELLFHGD